MDELNLLLESLIDSEIDDMILDLVYEIHSSIKGFPHEQFSINKTNSIDKQTCICPNCGQTNLIATRFAYHLAKCLGAGRQSSRQAQQRIVNQIMIITDSDQDHFSKDIENNSISEDGSSCTDSTSSSMTLINLNKGNIRLSNEDQDYLEDFYNNQEDDEEEDEDDWKPKKKKRKITTKNKKNKKKMNKDLPTINELTTSNIIQSDTNNSIITFDNMRPVTKNVVIPIVPLPISCVTTSDNEKIFFRNPQLSSETCHYYVESPLNLVDDEQSSIIIFKEDINNNN